MIRADRQSGLSLVELLIGLALGLVLILGVTQIFVSSKQGYRVQEASVRLQENGRFALEHVGRILRHADFWAGVRPENIIVRASASPPAGAATCNSAWILDVDNGLRGYEEAAAPPIDCFVAADYVPNTDVLVARYAEPGRLWLDSELEDTDEFAAGDKDPILRTLVGQFGILFNMYGTDPNNYLSAKGGGAQSIPRPDDTEDGVYNHRFRTDVLFVRPCSTKPNGTCTATADGGRPIPTLVVSRLSPDGGNLPGLVQTPLVEYVEQMQFEYGVDLDNDRTAERYYTATTMPAGAWPRVIMVRVGIIVRGDALEDFTDTETYNMPGGFAYTPPADLRRFPRRLVVKDFQIRNRVRG